MSKELLFSGRVEVFGGVTNEAKLEKACPEYFKDPKNPWNSYVRYLLEPGSNKRASRFKSEDTEEIYRQVKFFKAILRSFDLSRESKIAVASWMLSEILEEIPEY
jgi:hypothetical protein